MARKNAPKKNTTTAGGRILSFIERIERLNEEIEALKADVKEVKAEAKGEGYDVKTINELIKLRKMSPDERAEREALLDLYKAAIGMLDGTPLGRAALDRLNQPPPPPDDDGEAGDADEPAGDDPPAEEPPSEPEDPPISAADIAEARQKGADDAVAGKKILENPYVAGDPRRAAWDEGWCQQMGSDGMDLPPALRPTKKPKKPSNGPGGGAAP